MSRLIDKSVILLLCLLALGLSGNIAAPVAALLIATAGSSLVQLFSGTKKAVAVILIFTAMCGFIPSVFCTVPLMLYDALYEKKWWAVLPASLVLTSSASLTPYQYMITAAGILIAVIIYRRISGFEQNLQKVTELRDKVKEQNVLLSERNKRLTEAQDNEIRMATISERNRIAREIHDNVGHMLTRSLLQAGALMIVNKDENMKEPLSSLKDTLDSAMTSIRESVHGLHDESVDLKKILDDCLSSANDKFRTDLDFDVQNDIPGKLKFCFAGIVKEGVSNALKHSNGDRLHVILREHPAFYQLLIEDNGSCGKIKESGIGLRNMEDRAASVNGNISFTPSDKGFRIFMSVPKDDRKER
ncbi:sensor histidine kinase [Ruminococcus albus]|uniref:histidine kinase n=1 Tax=Ruminococcus albus (strain ATCC 27210 / DSM 20455 / JCM 14654 / NCDO 2250 / 7) TaxID=697329 RepID=E6UIN9_RUMA7|nr:histidine kinase [Ruminococcus albus]ADU21341.1 integral membrane sensor signal transduction histidine kinase [Ruminococcus albus 7 = DSM 20455]